MTDPARTLTFGVEYEFLLASVELSEPNPEPNDSRTIHFSRSAIPHYLQILDEQSNNGMTGLDSDFASTGAIAEIIAQTLQLNGIPAFPWFRNRGSSYPASDRDLAGWEVKTDVTVLNDGSEGNPIWDWETQGIDPYTYHGMELVSPILYQGFTRNSEIDDRHLREVEKVADILQRSFRVFVNKSCGLHVHVGDGKKGFPVGVLQKLGGLLWTFERGVEKVHPIHRRHPKVTEYCTPLRSSVLKRYPERSLTESLEALMSQPDVGKLSDMMWDVDTYRFGAYNLANLVPRHHGHNTVEFRQHEGCLDGRRVRLWAKFCVLLLDYCGRSSSVGVRNLCAQEVRREERSGGIRYIDDICDLIGFQEESAAWADVGMGEGEVAVEDEQIEVYSSSPPPPSSHMQSPD